MTLRSVIGYCVAAAFAWKRPFLLRRMRAGWRLPVVFHALPAEEFGRVLDWFAARGVVRQLDISMDDGWLCVKDYLPHLKRYGVRAKLYIAPGETMRGNVWTDVAVRTGVPGEEWRSWYRLNEQDRYAKLKDKKLPRHLITKEEVVEIAKSGLVDIENHTWSHLSATSRPIDEVMDEIRRAQSELTLWTGRAPQYLAWPFGRGNADLDAQAMQMGLRTVYTKNLPEGRSMAIENVTFQENIGRLLGAWPRVGETL